MKKKLVAMMLVVAVTALSLLGCGNEKKNNASSEEVVSQEESKSNEESAEESSSETETDEPLPYDHFAGTELKIAIMKLTNDTAEDRNQKYCMQKMEELTGIHINWIEVDQATATEKLGVMLSEKEQPDAYIGLFSNDDVVLNKDMLYDLTEDGLLDKYGNHIKDNLDACVEYGIPVYDMLTLSDGSIRSLPTNNAVSKTSDANGLMLINEDWLAQAGMEIPTTEEEFYNALVFFRDHDMNGNGDDSDEIPLGFRGNIQDYLGAYGIAGVNGGSWYWQIEDGKIVGNADKEEYRHALEFLHTLYEEGLLDKEGFTQTSEQYNSKIAEGKYGVYSGAWWTTNEGETLFVPYEGIEGVEPRKSGTKGYFFGNLSGFVVTKDCSNVEALLHWWNCAHQDKYFTYYFFDGEEDVSWYRDADGNICPGNAEAPTKAMKEDVKFDVTAYKNYHTMGNNNAPLRQPQWFYNTSWKAQQNDMIYPYLASMADGTAIMPKLVDPAAVEERTFIAINLEDPILNKFQTDAVINGITDESWNAYLKDLEAYGYYDLLDWWQGYYDGEY